MESELIIDGEVISLLPEIVNQPSLLKDIFSTSTWKQHLTEQQRAHLLEFLPQSLSAEDRNETVSQIFSGGDLSSFKEECLPSQSGNPIDAFIANVEKGYFSPSSYQIRRCQSKALKARNKYHRSQYHHDLLKEIIVSQQCHLAVATFPQLLKLSKRSTQTEEGYDKETETNLRNSSEKMYSRIMREVKQEVKNTLGCSEESLLSSESDSEENSTHSALTNQSSGLHNLSPNQLRQMLVQHKRRREAKVNTPDMQTNSIKLADVFTRTFGSSKKLTGVAVKRKRDESSKFSKQKKLKNSVHVKKRASTDKNPPQTNKPKVGGIATPSCFFQLIKNVILLAATKTTSCISSLVSDWLSSAEASHCAWTSHRTDWNELVQSSLDFMSKAQMVDNSLVRFVEGDSNSWAWVRLKPNVKESELLEEICSKWLTEVVEKLQNSTPLDGVRSFHAQERRRFTHAHQAFVYHIGGKRYPVPPVKGSTGPAKEGKVAREHSLLKSERPAEVTLLALTRDAVARLPGGRGTRNLVCSLVKESQYLAPIITDNQINAAVSGALDRLHYESDPCVKYEASVRSWVHLHGDRTPEQLERIHAESLGTPRRKKEKGAKPSNGKKQKPKPNELRNKLTDAKIEIGNPPEMKLLSDSDHVLETNSETAMDVTRVDSASSFPDMTSPLVINERGASKTTKNKMAAKKRIKNLKPPNQADNLPINQSINPPMAKPVATRTILLTQKQLLEMTKKMANPSSPCTSREVLITHLDSPSGAKKEQSVKVSHVTISNKTAAPAPQHSQPSLKLILKPASGEQQKPIAELVRVVDPASAAPQRNNQPGGKQHVLSAETLRRLSEQLSAVSSRPIKIVQQTPTWNEKLTQNQPNNQPGSKIINITKRRDQTTYPAAGFAKPTTNNAINNPISVVSAVLPSTSISSGISPLGDACRLNKTVYITANKNGDAIFNQEVPQSRIVHLVQKKLSGDASASIALPVGKSANQPNIQVLQGKPQTLQIMSGGKIQTVQVVRQANVSPLVGSPEFALTSSATKQLKVPAQSSTEHT